MAAEAGLDLYGLSGGAILDDFDGDGRLDLLVSSIGFADQMRFFHNAGDGHFEDRTERAGLTGEVGGLNLIQADYDNDGFLDVLVLRGGWLGAQGRFPLSLLRGHGDGTFTDVTRDAGLLRFAPTQTATWFDYDGDGWLDLFVGNESTPGDTHPCELYHQQAATAPSRNVAQEAGVDVVGFVKGVVSGDYDNDGRPDLYVSVCGGDNLLFHNDGPARSRARPGLAFHERGGHGRRDRPPRQLRRLLLRLRQRRLARPVRGRLRATERGGLPVVEDVAADYLGLPTTARRGGSITTERRDLSRTSRRPPTSTRSFPPWD